MSITLNTTGQYSRAVNATPAMQQAKQCNFKAAPFDSFNKFAETKTAEPQRTVKCEPPKIGFMRLFFSRLTQEQVDAINKSGQLPQNAKFIEGDVTNLYLTWNKFNLTAGTQKLPAGYEVKNNIFGFTKVVREGTKSIFIK